MKLDPQKTAFLTLDLQKGVFGLVPDSERVMSVAAKAVAFARQNQFRIIHVGLGFSEGHPEIPDFESSPFLRLKQSAQMFFRNFGLGTKARLWSQSRSGDHGNIRKTC